MNSEGKDPEVTTFQSKQTVGTLSPVLVLSLNQMVLKGSTRAQLYSAENEGYHICGE